LRSGQPLNDAIAGEVADDHVGVSVVGVDEPFVGGIHSGDGMEALLSRASAGETRG
jgi:hypothetical protein